MVCSNLKVSSLFLLESLYATLGISFSGVPLPFSMRNSRELSFSIVATSLSTDFLSRTGRSVVGVLGSSSFSATFFFLSTLFSPALLPLLRFFDCFFSLLSSTSFSSSPSFSSSFSSPSFASSFSSSLSFASSISSSPSFPSSLPSSFSFSSAFSSSCSLTSSFTSLLSIASSFPSSLFFSSSILTSDPAVFSPGFASFLSSSFKLLSSSIAPVLGSSSATATFASFSSSPSPSTFFSASISFTPFPSSFSFKISSFFGDLVPFVTGSATSAFVSSPITESRSSRFEESFVDD
uniref:Uncharacterized protein n=1 Tax=Opuntia streptacantha TaxID=393608 RepID=A0A7C9CKH2_OPUST